VGGAVDPVRLGDDVVGEFRQQSMLQHRVMGYPA
jgi:hypothetical protein